MLIRRREMVENVLAGLLLFCFFSGSSFSRILLDSASMVCDMVDVMRKSLRSHGE